MIFSPITVLKAYIWSLDSFRWTSSSRHLRNGIVDVDTWYLVFRIELRESRYFGFARCWYCSEQIDMLLALTEFLV